MAFSDNLQEIMNKKQISSYKLSKQLDVHISTITGWKNGADPNIENLKKLSNTLGVTVDELIAEKTQ